MDRTERRASGQASLSASLVASLLLHGSLVLLASRAWRGSERPEDSASVAGAEVLTFATELDAAALAPEAQPAEEFAAEPEPPRPEHEPPVEEANSEPQPQPEPQTEPPPPEARDETVLRIRPGVDDSMSDSPNWLGSATPTPHSAPRSAVDQPRWTPTPGVVGPPPSPELVRPTVSATREEASQPLPEVKPREALLERAEQRAVPVQEQTTAAASESNAVALPDGEGAPATTDAKSPQADGESAQRETRAAALSQTPRRSLAAVAGGESSPGGTPAAVPGSFQDAHSEAASTRDALEFRPGTPLAGKGVRITTSMPRFSMTARATLSPKNPLIVVRFKRDGTVAKAFFAPGQGTGHEEVDGPILDAVYRWKASGTSLLELPANDPTAVAEFKVRWLFR